MNETLRTDQHEGSQPSTLPGIGSKPTTMVVIHCVETVLRLEPEWADNRIAEHVGVSDHMVADTRQRLLGESPSSPESVAPPTRVGSDGKRRAAPGQKTITAAELLPHFQVQAKERQRAAGGDRKSDKAKSLPDSSPAPKADARDAAGKAVGVSGRSVSRGGLHRSPPTDRQSNANEARIAHAREKAEALNEGGCAF